MKTLGKILTGVGIALIWALVTVLLFVFVGWMLKSAWNGFAPELGAHEMSLKGGVFLTLFTALISAVATYGHTITMKEGK